MSDPAHRPGLSLDIVHQGGDWPDRGAIERAVVAAGNALAARPELLDMPCAACVALSNDAQIRVLNKAWLGKDKPTNVLSFPAAPPAAGHAAAAEERALGDVILAEETLIREAAELGIPFRHHLQHLVVHGLLHLLGHDHRHASEAEEMEALEVAILASLGIPDPYLAAGELVPD